MKTMKKALSDIALVLGAIVFVLQVVTSINFANDLEINFILQVIIRSLVIAVMFYLAALIVGDTIMKGVLVDLENKELDPLEGGLEQQIHENKKVKKVRIVERELLLKKKK